MTQELPQRIKLDNGKITIHKVRYRKPHKLAGSVNPNWWATVKLGRGIAKKTFSTGETNLKRAEKVAIDEAFKLEALNHQGISIHSIGFSDVCRHFLNEYKKRMFDEDREETFNHRQQIIRDIWIPAFHNRNLTNISSSDIYREQSNLLKKNATKRYKDSKGEIRTVDLKRPLAKSTISKYMIALREVFNFALSNGRINNIPEFPKVSTKREAFQPRPSLTEEEWVKFNQVLRNFEDDLFEDHENQRYYRRALRDWCQLISYSGLRTGEASLLKWKDWTPDRQGDVEFARLNVRGEEKKGRKTGNREVVGLWFINKTLERRKNDSKFTDPDDYIFCHQTRNAGKPIMSFRKSFDKALLKAGIGYDSKGNKLKGYSPYILRHTQATLALTNRNVDIYEVALNLGNQMTTTEKFYSKAKATDFAARLGRMDIANSD